jgi:hypothetical protein
VFLTQQSNRFRKDTSGEVSHGLVPGAAVFDDDNLVSCAGLVPVMTWAEQTGLSQLLGESTRTGNSHQSPSVDQGLAASPAP